MEKKKESVDKEQLVILGFIITFILICILIVYTVINTKTIDKLVDRVETLETSINSTYHEETGNNENYQQEQQSGYATNEFKTINPSDIKKESKGETIVVLWARQSCGYCVMYAPILTEVAREHNVTVRYINMESIVDLSTWQPSNQKEYDTLANLEGVGEWKTFAKDAIEGTPGTFFIKDNKIVYGIIGYVEKATIEDAFEKVGL